MRIHIDEISLAGSSAWATIHLGTAAPGAPFTLEKTKDAALVGCELRVVVRAARLPLVRGSALEVQKLWRDFFLAEARRLLAA
jgi:hypothetical protein